MPPDIVPLKLSDCELARFASILVNRFAPKVVVPKAIVSIALFCARIALFALSFVKPASVNAPEVILSAFAPCKFKVLPSIACATVKVSLTLIIPFVVP